MDSQSFCSCDSDASISSSLYAGPLYQMNSLLASLPSKRGLSQFYGGKSQSFSCVADVKCVEQLAKPVDNYAMRKKLKHCYSCGMRLNNHSYDPRISSSSALVNSKRS